jgi:polar amino acid transport system substrate-binding protein
MRRTKVLSVLVVAAAALIAGCSSSAKPASNGDGSNIAESSATMIDGVAVKENAALRAALPARYRTAGQFSFATNALGPPRTEVNASGQVVGAVPDLMSAVAAMWGLKAVVQKVSFDAQIPGVESGRFDIAADTGDFAAQAVLNYVDFMRAGAAFVVAAGNPKHITGLNSSLCGLTVSVTTGTIQQTQLQDLAATCKAAGKSPVSLLALSQGSLEVPITAGRASAAFDNTSTASLLVESEPTQFALGGPLIFEANLAFGVAKSNTAFFNDLRQTMEALVQDGAYKAIMAKWHQSALALPVIVVNTHAPFPKA